MTEGIDLAEPLLSPSESSPEENISRNVYVTYLLVFFWGLADSIWTGAVLSAWLFLIADDTTPDEVFSQNTSKSTHPNSIVGGLEGLQGLANLFTALPLGYLADKYGRARICKFGGFGFFFSSAFTVFVIVGDWSKQTELMLLGSSLVFWGSFRAAFSGPCQALFAESVPKGTRSHYYMILQNCSLAPKLVGPVMTICLFQFYGDVWNLSELRWPLVVGVLLEIPVGICALYLDDNLALTCTTSPSSDTNSEDTSEDITKEEVSDYGVGLNLTKRSIPYIVLASDLIYATGSGMTAKFFPLFFMNVMNISPSAVQGINIATNLLLLIFTYLSQKLSFLVGSVQIVMACRMCAIILLLVMATMINEGWATVEIIIPMFLVRTAAMGCTYPIDEAILMDNVEQSERSKWKSLDSVCAFGWCGSAFLGGIFADNFGYGHTFAITGCVQLTGCLTYSRLLPLISDENGSRESGYTRNTSRKGKDRQESRFDAVVTSDGSEGQSPIM